MSAIMSFMFGVFDPLSLVTDVSLHEGRSLEALLAPQPLSGGQQTMGGAVIDASYVHRDPPLLARLAESRIPWVVNPQSVRFASPRFRSITSLAHLPYAPSGPLDPSRFDSQTKEMVRGALEFQARHEPSMYLVPTLPITKVSARVFRAFHELHRYAADLNGSPNIPLRPMLAAAYPSYPVMRGRFGLFDRLDRPFEGAYVQPLQLNTRRDGVEKLVAYARFLQTASDGAAPIIAGRAGPFGLVLAAFGIDLFESSLDAGGSCSISRLERPPREPVNGQRAGGRSKAVYLAALRTPLPYTIAAELLTSSALSAQLGCLIGECRRAGLPYALEQPRLHFFHVRQQELAVLRNAPSTQFRVPIVLEWLRSAIDQGRVVNRIREEQGRPPLDFGHLDRWVGVLARVATVAITEDGQ
jgi:hypothetical protein